MVPRSDELYDSAAIAHDTRWRLSFPSWEETRAFAQKAARDATDRLGRGEPDALEQYFIQLATFHTDMHAEAFTYTRQTLGFTEPTVPSAATLSPPQLDFELTTSPFPAGGSRWALSKATIRSSSTTRNGAQSPRRAVRDSSHCGEQREFLRFVESGGYRDRSCWTEEGWWWKQALGAEHPVYWRRESDGRWLVRRYDAWVPD